MKTNVSKENEGHLVKASKTKREPFKALQVKSNDKKNFAGRGMVYKDAKRKEIALLCNNCKTDLNRSNYVDKGVQVGKKSITAEDLTSTEEASAEYWRQLAETRGKALEESLEKNQKLQDLYESLQEDHRICNKMLDEARHLIEVLKEIMGEDGEEEAAEETPNGA